MTEFLQVVEATFTPKRRDTLKPEAAAQDGVRREWQASWVVEDGPYEGQWAFVQHGEPFLPWFGWVPAEDLTDVRVARPAR